MNRATLKRIIVECCNDVVFSYNGKPSGVTSEVYNSVPVFQVWHGSETKDYTDVDMLIKDKFFSGKSLMDLVGFVEFEFM